MAKEPQFEQLDVEVSLFTMDDWQALRALRLEALKNEPQAFGASYDKQVVRTDEEWQAKYSQTQGEHPSKIFVIAKQKGKAVGMAGAYQREDPKAWKIVAVYVSPEFRGRGISEKLVREAMAQVEKKQEVEELSLMVNIDQIPAVNLYKKLGFQIEKTLKDETMGDGLKHDEYVMVKQLRSSNSH